MMGQQPRTDSLFYYFRLGDQIPHDACRTSSGTFAAVLECLWAVLLGGHSPKS